jgi:ankyrin repeat protein
VNGRGRRKSRTIVRLLLDAGAKIDIVSGEYTSALHAAIHFGDNEKIRMLLDAGANVNVASEQHGTAP